MTTGQGETKTLSLLPLSDSRAYQYCELVFIYGELGSDIYSTSPLDECSLEWWPFEHRSAIRQRRAGRGPRTMSRALQVCVV